MHWVSLTNHEQYLLMHLSFVNFLININLYIYLLSLNCIKCGWDNETLSWTLALAEVNILVCARYIHISTWKKKI